MKQPIAATLALALVLLNALVSLIFGVLILLGCIPGVPDQSVVRLIMSGSAFAGSGILVLLYFLLVNHNRLGFYLALVIFLLITALVFADEIGFADWIAFGLSATPMVLLVLARKWFLTGSG
jgi:hypothetical protein